MGFGANKMAVKIINEVQLEERRFKSKLAKIIRDLIINLMIIRIGFMNQPKNIFFIDIIIISLSYHEQVCLSGLRFERYFSHHRAT